MSETVMWDGIQQDYDELKRKLKSFGETIGQGSFDRCQSGILSSADAKELQSGTFYVLSGLNELIKDANSLAAIHPDALPLIYSMIGHARALVGGALYVGKHLEITDTAKSLTQKAQTKAANQGNENKRDERLEFLRPLLAQAQRNAKGNFIRAKDLLKQVNKSLECAKDASGERKFEDIESLQTLRRYGKALGKDDTMSSSHS